MSGLLTTGQQLQPFILNGSFLAAVSGLLTTGQQLQPFILNGSFLAAVSGLLTTGQQLQPFILNGSFLAAVSGLLTTGQQLQPLYQTLLPELLTTMTIIPFQLSCMGFPLATTKIPVVTSRTHTDTPGSNGPYSL